MEGPHKPHKFFFFFLACLFFILFLPDFQTAIASQPPTVTLKWLGHACFLLETQVGHPGKPYRILLDPYSPAVGYPVYPVAADAVFISHEHYDHNNAEMAPGAKVYRGLENGGKSWARLHEVLAPGITLRTVGVYHDPNQGKERGLNSVAILNFQGITIVHLGDLGHLLTPSQIKAIGPVDLLLIPVGGVYTLDGKEAKEVARKLHPRIIIPMHFKTAYTRLPIQSEEAFLENSPWPVKKLQTSTLFVQKKSLPPKTLVYLLQPLLVHR